MERRIRGFLEEKRTLQLLRDLKTVEHLIGGNLLVNGRKYVNFSSNDYLGIASHPSISKAASKALSPFVGTTSSR
ncbi:MAG: 8-amino-7-oxononanoate synthase, partial [Candidatus Omnitrophica bacterium]|nr:8-amino-7-oxononanoate synthase [Candidatus Omnitrophota bacterium]